MKRSSITSKLITAIRHGDRKGRHCHIRMQIQPRSIVLAAFAVAMLAERIWKHLMVIRFFRRPRPSAFSSLVASSLPRVSILQPILSGDPSMADCLERNVQARSSYEREFVWLVDTDDLEAQRICHDLIVRYPKQSIQLVLLPPPGERVNPKMVKLIAGANMAQGQVLCVLDDDTVLPDDGLEQCLPYLEGARVGLAFGLPYYSNFSTLWSCLVAYFVNSNSLLTYIPYTVLTQPFTINGMFYALKRETYDAIGGFTGIEQVLADDFAVAQRVRAQGYMLAQTPLRHSISTQVSGPRPYLNLMQRWFIFPRESLMRHLQIRDKLVLYGLAMAPTLFPLLVLLSLFIRPSRSKLAYALLYFGYNFAIFIHLNNRYLYRASPLRSAWLVPLLQIVFPLQLLAALFSPQRIIWRGHTMRVEKGGTFQLVQRRAKAV